MRFAQWFEDNDQLQQLVKSLEAQYPEITKLFAWENDREVSLSSLEVHKKARNQGIGSAVMQALKKHAASVGKPLTLEPQAESRKKAALERFYRRHGLYRNKGRKKDYRLRPGMYWRPEWESQE
jgi:GNAT superfamily N-acetyltransferase